MGSRGVTQVAKLAEAESHFAGLGYGPWDAPGEILAPGGASRQEKREEKREAAKDAKRAAVRAPPRAGAPAPVARAEIPRPMTSDEQSELKKMLGKGGAGFRVDRA